MAALCLVQGRRAWALAALAAGLLVKDSAILLVALYVLQLAMTRLRLRQRSARVQLAAGLGTLALGAALAWTLVPWLLRRSPTTANLLRPGARTVEYCVRSVECLPRATLFWLLHLPTAAFAINLAFRVAAVGWLLYVAVQSARDGRFLRWAATFLFLYYLYLHAVSQSWYLLALLPLLPYASGRLYRPICVFLVSLVLYYAVDIPMSCGGNDVVRWALIHVIEGLVVIAPATVCLFTFERRGDPGHPQRRS